MSRCWNQNHATGEWTARVMAATKMLTRFFSSPCYCFIWCVVSTQKSIKKNRSAKLVSERSPAGATVTVSFTIFNPTPLIVRQRRGSRLELSRSRSAPIGNACSSRGNGLSLRLTSNTGPLRKIVRKLTDTSEAEQILSPTASGCSRRRWLDLSARPGHGPALSAERSPP